MKRLFWIALVSFCAACSSPSDDGKNESAKPGPSGSSVDSTVTAVEVDPPLAAAEETEGAEEGETTEPTETTDATAAPEKAEVTETTEPADMSDAADATTEMEPADGPKMPDAVAVVDPTDSPESATSTDVTDSPDAVAAVADVVGLVAKKPAEGRFVETDQGFMVPYKMTIPGTAVEFEMVPIPGGKFKLGSPDSEEDRGDDEGPQMEVEMAPFWMSKYELTWSEYRRYMDLVDTFIGFMGYRIRPVTDNNKFDAVSAPSNLYDPSMTFKKGENPRQPAVTMTAYAAKQYTKWLSKLTGQVYRLPSEAEWEYACRAGTSTAYYFGDDPADLGDYAWYADNSDETTHPVGEKQPNAWDLYDMYGNVAEIVLDEYRDDAYGQFAGKAVAAADAIAWPTDYDFRVCRGGSYDEFEDGCRSATRKATAGDKWKTKDPNEPKSPWWYADEPALAVGVRIVRPLATPSKEVLDKVWEPAVESILESAEQRMNEGRGAWGLADPGFPAAVEELKRKKAAN